VQRQTQPENALKARTRIEKKVNKVLDGKVRKEIRKKSSELRHQEIKKLKEAKAKAREDSKEAKKAEINKLKQKKIEALANLNAQIKALKSRKSNI